MAMLGLYVRQGAPWFADLRAELLSKGLVTFASGTRGEDVVDWMIGTIPDLPFAELVVSRTRFGISLDKDMDRSRNGMLRVKIKPCQRGKLIAVNARGNRRVKSP